MAEEAPEWAKALIERLDRIEERLDAAPAPDSPEEDEQIIAAAPPPPRPAGPPPCNHQHQELVRGVIKCRKCGLAMVRSGIVGEDYVPKTDGDGKAVNPSQISAGLTDYRP
jgi:hypothetical protein